MKIKLMRVVAAIVVLGCVGRLVWAQTSQTSTSQPAQAEVKTITLPFLPAPSFPDGPGHDAFMVQCAICHTQRYVTMQPAFSRKVWTDEVNKMINTYKALVPPDQVPAIVDYLM